MRGGEDHKLSLHIVILRRETVLLTTDPPMAVCGWIYLSFAYAHFSKIPRILQKSKIFNTGIKYFLILNLHYLCTQINLLHVQEGGTVACQGQFARSMASAVRFNRPYFHSTYACQIHACVPTHSPLQIKPIP